MYLIFQSWAIELCYKPYTKGNCYVKMKRPCWNLWTTPEVRYLRIWFLKWKFLRNMVLFLNNICYLQQQTMFFNDFLNFFLVCKDIEPRCGRTRARGFFSTVRVVSWLCVCLKFFLKNLWNFQGNHFLRICVLEKVIQCVI